MKFSHENNISYFFRYINHLKAKVISKYLQCYLEDYRYNNCSRRLRRRERPRDESLSYSRRKRREPLNGAETASRLRFACPLGWAK